MGHHFFLNREPIYIVFLVSHTYTMLLCGLKDIDLGIRKTNNFFVMEECISQMCDVYMWAAEYNIVISCINYSTNLEVVNRYTYLGLILDEFLNYDTTAAILAESGGRGLGPV